jgi:DNA-directed RNA polymerase subunit delta
MKRIIVDFSKLSEELKTNFVTAYPEGYESEDIISFKNSKGETIEAIELKTEDTVYLVKVNKRLAPQMEAYSDEALDMIISENGGVDEFGGNSDDLISFDEQDTEYEEDDDTDDLFSDSE